MHTKPGFQTEIDFELPKGYVDDTETLHRRGRMRLATAADEILPLRDPRVQQNEAYLIVIILSRVITRLGSLTEIHTGVIENLYASDLAYLQRLYDKFNASDDSDLETEYAQPRMAGGETVRRFSAVGES